MSRTNLIRNTTHFSNGVSNVGPDYSENPMHSFGMFDPTHHYYTYFDDFFTFQPTAPASATGRDYDVTIVATGTPTQTVADLPGGVLAILNGTVDNNSTFIEKNGESFKVDTTKPFAFKARIMSAEATQIDWIVGLVDSDTPPLDFSDGIAFRKSDGGTAIDFPIESGDADTGDTGIATFVASAWTTLAFEYTPPTFGESADMLRVWVTSGTTNGEESIDYLAPCKTFQNVSSNVTLPSTELTVQIGVQNGTGSPQTLNVDYVLAVFNGSRVS